MVLSSFVSIWAFIAVVCGKVIQHYVWRRSKENSGASAFSFHHEGSKNRTQI